MCEILQNWGQNQLQVDNGVDKHLVGQILYRQFLRMLIG